MGLSPGKVALTPPNPPCYPRAMLRYSIAALVAVGGLFGAAPASAAQGWHVVQTQSGGPTSRTVHLYYADHHLRMESDGDPNAMIIHLPTGNLTIIDGDKKIYTQASLQDLMAMRDKMKASMKERMKSMPEEMRKNIEKMIEEQEAAQNKPLKLEATGKKDKVGGYACTYYTWEGPDGTGQACIADKLPVSTKAFQKDAKALIAAMKKAGAGSSAAASLVELQLADKGFPVKSSRSISMGPQKIEIVSTLDKIEKKDVPASKLKAPKDFKKTSFEAFNQMQTSPTMR